MVSDPSAGEPNRLSPTLVQHYRELLAIHADDPVLGACPVCLEIRCWDWRHAWAQLSRAGELLPVGSDRGKPR